MRGTREAAASAAVACVYSGREIGASKARVMWMLHENSYVVTYSRLS
jgi:hypothetical protein